MSKSEMFIVTACTLIIMAVWACAWHLDNEAFCRANTPTWEYSVCMDALE